MNGNGNRNGTASERAKALSAFINFILPKGHLPIGAKAYLGDRNCTLRDLTGGYVLMRDGRYVGRLAYQPPA